MSGICGIVALDGAEPRAEQVAAMTAMLEHRGPDGTHHWLGRGAALGHTMLATTPEALVEVLPLTDVASGCTITADVRLDNREELIPALGLSGETRVIGDGELILRAYLEWGEACLDHFLGDFAFAIWDPRAGRLFCARDQIGIRQLIYCHVPGRLLAFATEPRALLTHPDVPRRISEGRIADFILDLEGINYTETFFEDLFRLPPAHCLICDASGLMIRRYWRLEPGPELKLESDDAYAEAFLEIFTKAVASRLRSAGPVGAMLSGGMDSGSIVAIASQLLATEHLGPLITISAVGPNSEECVETRTIHAALAMPNLAPTLVDHANMQHETEDLIHLAQQIQEPFDGHMNLIRTVYRAAQRQGVKVLLDGAGGDLLMHEGSHLARLMRRGRLIAAVREARAYARFYGAPAFAWRLVARGMWRAFVPPRFRSLCKRLRMRVSGPRSARGLEIEPEFAERIDLQGRLREFQSHIPYREVSLAEEKAMAMTHPSFVAGRERYDRVASALNVEPRDPFLDLRLIAFCMSLPAEQLLRAGWPKIIMRQAMAGILPEAVRWRQGKEHLGWRFSEELLDEDWAGWERYLAEGREPLGRYVKLSSMDNMSLTDIKKLDKAARSELGYLLIWLDNVAYLGADGSRGTPKVEFE